MKLLKSAVHFLCFLLNAYLVIGQSMSGKVTDQNYISIPGVYILNVSTGNYTHSTENGAFNLDDVNVSDSLEISHIGFESYRIKLKSTEDPLHIILKEQIISLDEVIISPQIDALKIISEIDLQTSPVTSSQDILQQIPGLFIGQHAGGGKAEQIFLRGFDIDHGTDISISVDGIPVNMVSHAHGQGYADLHFVIPETIDNVDFGKGPYYADQGNFNTAGYIDFRTKRSLDHSSIKLEVGQFNTKRILGLLNILEKPKQQAYIASEFLSTDGPFESPQGFSRINIYSKYTNQLSSTDQISLTASHFTSRWDASGQIPQRAIDDGSITRFGAIDDTEGGTTTRTNLSFEYEKFFTNQSFLSNQVYYSNYNFELFSNFTFFLEDPINGDQIKQKENRHLLGLKSEYNYGFNSGTIDGLLQAGIQLRHDQSMNNGLSRTLNRTETLEFIQLGDIYETNFGSYLNARLNWGQWTINPSLRLDVFNYQYNDALLTGLSSATANESIVSPKLNVFYNYSNDLQFFVKTGKGFHSNDTRVSVAQSGREILPAAFGTDIGIIWKPIPRLLLNTSIWYLHLDQEFVYVGDAGIVEPSGKTKRQGVDFGLRYQPTEWLFWNFDANVTKPRSIDAEPNENYIPLAPLFTVASGLKFIHLSGLKGSINLRHLKDRPASEDYSITAGGYTVIDVNVDYNWRSMVFGIEIQNLFNTEWNETQFATESRLFNEAAPVEEIHFTPGTPFFIKSKVELKF